jgi:protein-S-isoprenylcysteine O-methyltransferase Ste14
MLLLRHALIATNPIGIAIQIAAVLFMIWGRTTLGLRSFHAGANPTAGKLITTGPYRIVRHPIYAAILYFVWTAGISYPSILNITLVLVATGALLVRIFAEEHFLRARYPEYEAYSARTKRVIPYIF